MIRIKKVLLFVLLLNLFCIGTVYADETTIGNVVVDESGEIINEDGVAAVDGGEFSISDSDLLTAIGDSSGEESKYRDNAVFEESKITEEEDSILNILAIITVAAGLIIAAIVLLKIKNKKSGN